MKNCFDLNEAKLKLSSKRSLLVECANTKVPRDNSNLVRVNDYQTLRRPRRCTWQVQLRISSTGDPTAVDRES